MEIKKELDGRILIREQTFEVFDEHLITICLFKMPGQTFLLWVGNQQTDCGKLTNLCLAVNGHSTNVIGNEENSVLVNNLSIRLSEKFNSKAPSYLSYNLKGAAYSSKQFIIKVEELVNEFLSRA